jgi:hypothetical protein
LGAGRGGVAEEAADALQGLADLAGHDPDLVRVALGDLRQHLHVLVSQQALVRVAVRGSGGSPEFPGSSATVPTASEFG